MNREIAGPFGTAKFVMTLPTTLLTEMYWEKCGVDISPHFGGISQIELFECNVTGYRFWRPDTVAGNETFYREMSVAWAHYYRDWRWEYGPMLPLLSDTDRLLEVGCGRGYFLRNTESRVASALGLEFNREAIATKVTSHEMRAITVEELARAEGESFDVVCSFQVLEHVINPAAFIKGCMDCLKPGGILAFSTPNHKHVPHAKRQDAFDLPPHHMGHFSRNVYKRLADIYGLGLESIYEQPRYSETEDATKIRRRGRLLQMSISAIKGMLNVPHRIIYGPGHTMLVVFRKPLKR